MEILDPYRWLLYLKRSMFAQGLEHDESLVHVYKLINWQYYKRINHVYYPFDG